MEASMDTHTLLIFALTSGAVSLTPGPNMLYAMSLGLRFGPRRAAAGGAGLALALGGMALVSALGLGAVITASATAFEVLKWFGVGYLIWLGVASWRAPVHPIGATDAGTDDRDGSPAGMFVRGLFVTLSNPKALVFLTALFPQFIDTTAPLAPQLAALIGVMMVLEFASIMLYAVGGGTLAAKLSSVGAARLVNRLTGGLLIGAGGLLALARRF